MCARRIAGAHADVFISQFNEYYRRKTLVFHFYFPANSCGNSDVLHPFFPRSTFNAAEIGAKGVSDNCVSEAVQEYLKALIRFVLFFKGMALTDFKSLMYFCCTHKGNHPVNSGKKNERRETFYFGGQLCKCVCV